ncbi:MAG: hypothetical protein UV70_C0005G0016 [Parcubacteria group bacterium GW2011_GWA2_43_13]|nr:MAG: hypothetical protein UV70_C0005G0016 [Parcubacteria group bacterium GW2011_GWA2_43_13]OGY71276.1 MAG: hypothetical protein A2986_04195 [Candidatus Jacksonbacteria bacterium RIFCSPLOWO2_01_FULL_44_13]HAZ17127.1 hypothetical protein [Candidatus Jacksonbacteria bacterium]
MFQLLHATHYKLQNKRGFTLIEIILSIATIGIIAGISMPLYGSFQVRNDLDIAVSSIAQSSRRAQALSQAVDGDTSWGVNIQSGSMTVFKGASYAVRDSSFDEIVDVPTSISPSGMSEVIFTKLTGLPQTTGTFTLTSNANETRTITINAKGMVSY